MREEVSNLTAKLQGLNENKGISFIDNDNVSNSCLNGSKVQIILNSS